MRNIITGLLLTLMSPVGWSEVGTKTSKASAHGISLEPHTNINTNAVDAIFLRVRNVSVDPVGEKHLCSNVPIKTAFLKTIGSGPAISTRGEKVKSGGNIGGQLQANCTVAIYSKTAYSCC